MPGETDSSRSDTERDEREERLRRLARDAAEQTGQSILSWLNPFNWGFGGLLLMGLVGFGIYYLGFTDRGREMMGNFFNNLSPEWQQRLAGIGSALGLLPEGLTGQSATALMAIGRRHGVTGMNVENYLQPDIIYDAMIEQPQALLAIVRGMDRTAEGNDPKTQRAMAAIRQIVNNPQRLGTLMNDTHRANTYALLEALSPVPFAPGALGTFVDAVGMENGRVKPEFAQFLNGMLNTNVPQRNAAMMDFLLQTAERNPQALQALARSVNLQQVQDAGLRTQIQTLQTLAGDPESLRSSLRVERNLQQQGTSAAEVLSQMGTITGMVNVLTDPAKLALIPPNAQSLGHLAARQAQGQQAGSPMHTVMRFFGTGQMENGQQVAVNVRALHGFFATVMQNPHNTGANLERTRSVMRSMLKMMGMPTGPGEQIPALNPQQVHEFFRDEGNVRAFDALLNQVNPTNLPAAMRTAITTLRANWAPRGGSDTSYVDNGLAEIFHSSPRGTNWLINRPAETIMSRAVQFLPNGIESFIGSVLPTSVTAMPQSIRDNTSYLIEVRDALANVGVTQSAAAAPAPGGSGQAASRA